MHFNTFHYKTCSKGRKQTHTYKSERNIKFPTDHSGVDCMYELFQVRCMVSPNEVEETKVWTGYSNISSKDYSNRC